MASTNATVNVNVSTRLRQATKWPQGCLSPKHGGSLHDLPLHGVVGVRAILIGGG
jgi:hypothetical protein